MATERQSRLQQILLNDDSRRRLSGDEAACRRQWIDATTSAVAKTLRNELTVVSGNNELNGMSQTSDAVHRFAWKAQIAATAANQVLLRLSMLRRVGSGKRSSMDVHRELNSLRSQFAPQVPSDVHLDWNSQAGNFSLYAEPDEFRMIVLEVLQNSLNAMSKGGTLAVASTQVALLSPTQEEQKRWWQAVEVSDTGKGMTHEQCTATLAPFKSHDGEPDLALGLCLLDRFVLELEGVLHIESTEEQGTTVTMLLPLEPLPHVSASDIRSA